MTAAFAILMKKNFVDLKARAKELLAFIGNRKEKRLLCVSHRIFLKMVFMYMEQGEELDSNDFAVLDYHTKVENTAVTICEYDPWKKFVGRNPWRILAVNDAGILKK